jgi:thiamine biosynthesis lipoprotein
MGTLQVLLLGGAPEEVLRQGAQEAFETFERIEQSLSKFLPSSDLSILNQLGAWQAVAAGSDLRLCLERAREAWEVTGGAFDPTVGRLLEAWGLVGMEGRIPDAKDIDGLVRAGGMGHVIVGSRTVQFDRPGISVDLGGIAKGYAVDRVARDLRARGIPVGAVISGRSSVVVWGAPPGEERWRFEVVHPSDPEEILAELRVEPGAISSSATDERRFERGGVEYGHIVDPRTGHPARGVRAVTVWTETALLGDVLSTTLFVLGREALAPGGAAERLVRLWHGGEGEPRASFLLALENQRLWGGIELVRHAVGLPAFE